MNRTWVPLPAIWYPVWVTLDGDRSTDALEEAILGIVTCASQTAAHVARALCLPVPLVEVASANLVARSLLRSEPGGILALSATNDRSGDGRSAQPGWIAWNPRANRPVRQLWLDPDPPSEEMGLRPPPGWTVLPSTSLAEASKPRTSQVDEMLRLLPSAGELLVLRPLGSGVQAVDGARVTRLRRKVDGRWERGAIWVPVEHRVSGGVVWHPSLVPLPEVLTDLDPAGWASLVSASGAVMPALVHAQQAVVDDIAPGVLKEAGFQDVRTLQEAAQAQTQRELGSLGGADWDPVRIAVEQAIIAEILAPVIGANWQRAAAGWADVLEQATAIATPRFAALVNNPQRPSDAARQSLQRLLGTNYNRIRDVCQNDRQLGELQHALKSHTDTIGTRVLAMGVAAVFDTDFRRQLEQLRDKVDLFRLLDAAVKNRNRIIHPKEDDEPVHVAGFRGQVIEIVRGLAAISGFKG